MAGERLLTKTRSQAIELSATAVLIGLLLDHVATFTLVQIGSFAWLFARDGAESAVDPAAAGFALPGDLFTVWAIGAACSVFGGYAAGRIAGRRETEHGLLVGIGDVVVGVAMKVFFAISPPIWYDLAAFLAVVPAASLGGRLARFSRERAAF